MLPVISVFAFNKLSTIVYLSKNFCKLTLYGWQGEALMAKQPATSPFLYSTGIAACLSFTPTHLTAAFGSWFYSLIIFKQVGSGTLIWIPVGVSSPVWLFRLNTTTLSLSWLATSKYLPDGSRVKFRGTFPSVA